jgi:hypothetical protein
MTLIFLSTAWLIGIAAAHSFSPPLTVIGLLAILPFAGLLLWGSTKGKQGRLGDGFRVAILYKHEPAVVGS